jgi:hypothetical protein
LFARRQRTSMSAYFTNSLTPPSGVGLLASPLAAGNSQSGSAWLGPERWPTVLPRGRRFTHGSRPSTRAREGAAWSLPLLGGGKFGNGCQINTRPCLANRPVAPLRNRRLDSGSRRFWLGLCRAQRCRRIRRCSPAALALSPGRRKAAMRGLDGVARRPKNPACVCLRSFRRAYPHQLIGHQAAPAGSTK